METLTFILPTADEDMSELRSMCFRFFTLESGVNALVVPWSFLYSYMSPLHESIVYSYVVANTIKYMMI